MKRKDLERALKELGWWLERQGRRHALWTNGSEQEPVPRHGEVAEPLAKKILRTARRFPGKAR